MEVILKKSKITAGILKQTVRCTREDFENAEILGWCKYDNFNYIVCYRSGSKTISKYPMWTSVETQQEGEEQFGPIKYNVVVKYSERFGSTSYAYTDEQECQKVFELFTKAKEAAIEKGQFYI